MNWYFFLALLFRLTLICYSANETFAPTKDWQEIRTGQTVPQGLHIRVNLSSGKKEGKLVEDHLKNASVTMFRGIRSSTLASRSEVPKKTPISLNLEEALKSMDNDRLGLERTFEQFMKLKKNYRNLDEIKRSLKNANLDFKTEAEIISELISEFQNNTKPNGKSSDIIKILDSFDYLVHHIDNAIWFVDEGGLERVLLPLIVNNTNSAIRAHSMRVLGALTQNNPKAKVSVFEKNFASHLIQIMISSKKTEELSTALYAFGSLLRKFPLAQRSILPRAGLTAIATVLSKDCELKIKAKALTLISDLIVEKKLALENDVQENASQYLDLNFEEWLINNQFCQSISIALIRKRYDLMEQPENLEYFVQAMNTMKHICQEFWKKDITLRSNLLLLKNSYLYGNDEYRLDVGKWIVDLMDSLFEPLPDIRDEL